MTKETDTRDYVAEFLAAGKTVTKVPTGHRNDPQTIQKFYGGRPKKQPEPPAEDKK